MSGKVISQDVQHIFILKTLDPAVEPRDDRITSSLNLDPY